MYWSTSREPELNQLLMCSPDCRVLRFMMDDARSPCMHGPTAEAYSLHQNPISAVCVTANVHRKPAAQRKRRRSQHGEDDGNTSEDFEVDSDLRSRQHDSEAAAMIGPVAARPVENASPMVWPRLRRSLDPSYSSTPAVLPPNSSSSSSTLAQLFDDIHVGVTPPTSSLLQ